jgi:hypothetical protein
MDSSYLLVGILALIAFVSIVVFYRAFSISKKAEQLNIQKMIFYRKAYLVSIELFCILTILAISFHLIFIVLIYLLWIRWIIPWFEKIYDYKIIDKIDSFILYLRSFKDDRSNNLELGEREVIKTFDEIFPVFAVGAPTELLPLQEPKGFILLTIGKNKLKNLPIEQNLYF